MPVEIGFCDQCRELTCEDPDVCAEARVCQVAADGLRDLADVVEHSYDLAAELEFAVFGVPVIGYGRTPEQHRAAYEACAAALGPDATDESSAHAVRRSRMFGPVRFEVYGPADVIEAS